MSVGIFYCVHTDPLSIAVISLTIGIVGATENNDIINVSLINWHTLLRCCYCNRICQMAHQTQYEHSY